MTIRAIDRTVPDDPKHFAEVFPDMPDPRPLAPGQRRQDQSEEIRQCQDIYIDINRRLKYMGVTPITVINFNPFPLKPDGMIFGGLEIPGVPSDENRIEEEFKPSPNLSLELTDKGTPYIRFTFRRVMFSIADRGGAMFIPREHVPIQLAAEINRQFYDIGGCFAYYGDVPVHDERAVLREDETNLDDEPTHAVVLARFKEAQSKMIKFMLHQVQVGNNEYNKPNRSGMNNIGVGERRAATYLYNRKRLASLPVWIVKESDPDQAPLSKTCPACRGNCNTDALMCTNCRIYIFDVYEAYKAGLVQDDDVANLRRLSPAQLEEFGLDPEISIERKKQNRGKKPSANKE